MRDLYRFRVTSALFEAVEAAGGRVESAIITGKVTFLIAGEEIECSIVEKMRQSFQTRPSRGARPFHGQPLLFAIKFGFY